MYIRYFFNIIPLFVLNKIDLDKQTQYDIKMLFDIKTPATMKPIINRANIHDNLKKLSTNKNITIDIYNK